MMTSYIFNYFYTTLKAEDFFILAAEYFLKIHDFMEQLGSLNKVSKDLVQMCYWNASHWIDMKYISTINLNKNKTVVRKSIGFFLKI